nr:MAG TPA_asm: Prohead core protein protease [Caudoviricetes sp.]
MGQQAVLHEATAKAKATESKGIWRIKLIEGDVHGSSGYYPASVLERDGATAFPAGTHIYLDHPTWEEDWQRPERSVKDLVGAMTEAAQYEDDPVEGKGLYAKVKFRESVREDVEFYAETAGMSIRAIGITDESPATGELIVTELVEGLSVDIVTHAGAGGKLVSMAENARKGTESGTEQRELFAQLTEKDKQGLAKLFESITALSERFDRLEQKAAEHEQKVEEANTLTAAQLIEKLDATDLPAVSRKRLAEAYKPGDDFDAAIAAEVEYFKQVQESVKPEGKGHDTNTGTGTGTVREAAAGGRDAYKNAFAQMGW